MNRILSSRPICTYFIANVDDAQGEVYQRGWNMGHSIYLMHPLGIQFRPTVT